MRRLLSTALAIVLAASAWALLRSGDWSDQGITLRPASVSLGVGERATLRLLVHEVGVLAIRFRLRFDEQIVTLDAARPAYESVLDGGNAIHLSTRRTPGVLEVQGTSVIGGRTFDPLDPVYEFVLRGVRPGRTLVTIDDVTIVDGVAGYEAARPLPAAASRVTVAPD